MSAWRGYWCEYCKRWIPADDRGVIVHDDVPHPRNATPGPVETLQ